MGATYWEQIVAYEEDVEQALHRLQACTFQESGYNLAQLLEERIKDMLQAVQWCEQDDPYDLIEFYRDALSEYKKMAAIGIPEDTRAQIERLRRIEEISGDWIGNILDMRGICEGPKEGMVQRLSEGERKEMFGTATPSLYEARTGTRKHANSIIRGSALCFPVYESGQPASWFFAGYSAD